jgi:Protein kinase domain
MSLQAGTRLGPYEVVALIGAGGMGEVYRARDTRLDRTVAIKVLPTSLISDAAARQRLEREARAVAALSHPHICALFDIGHQEDGTDFLVMERGKGCRRWLDVLWWLRHPQHWRQVAWLSSPLEQLVPRRHLRVARVPDLEPVRAGPV